MIPPVIDNGERPALAIVGISALLLSMKPMLRLLPLLTAVLLLGGCATTHRVQVSALADPTLAGANRTYAFAPNPAQGQATGDLQLREAQRHVRAALVKQGFREAGSTAAAELNIFVDFGIGDPVSRTHTFSTPVYAELGGGYTRVSRQTTDANGKLVTVTETVRIPGRYERVGTDVSTNTVTTYRKHLRLSARLNEPGVAPEKGSEVWTVTAISNDQRADIRAVLPLLAQAITPYLGTDTGQALILEFEEKNGALVPTR